MDVGTALATIRDERRYRDAGYSDFDDYCRERWGFSRRRAGQLIEAATVVEGLGKILPTPAPSIESHVAELAKVAPEHRAETWAAVVKERGADVTARAKGGARQGD